MIDRIGTNVVREALISRREIALVDVREEGVYAEAHPLFAASMPLSRLELEAWERIPRLATQIVVYDNGEGLAQRAVGCLRTLGYSAVSLLEGGLQGWSNGGGEIFKDVNVPSKAFGELVEATRHTPSLSASEVQSLIESNADVVILDARRYDEYQTMSIPKGVNVPGGELVYRLESLVGRAETTVIVNCAGRTRSIIGTQSLINAGIGSRVFALSNGTIGWSLAGQALEHGQSRRFAEPTPQQIAKAIARARAVAARAGVRMASSADLNSFLGEAGRTTYRFDVRTPEEYEEGHLAGFRSAPGGQLVQETDAFAPVRGARIVLSDDNTARANMTASWLAQMGWEVFVNLDGLGREPLESGARAPRVPTPPRVRVVSPVETKRAAEDGNAVILDLAPSAIYARGHIPQASFVIRSDIVDVTTRLGTDKRIIVTSSDGQLAQFAVADLEALGVAAWALGGGTRGWIQAGQPLTTDAAQYLSPPVDRYRRPYEGTDNAAQAMQAYLDWEFGLVDQLARDGTHGFKVI